MKKINILLSCCFIVFFVNLSVLKAQTKQPSIWWNKTWNGLRVAQPADEMPRGNAPLTKPNVVKKQQIEAKLQVSGKDTWLLSQGWELIEGYKTRTLSRSLFDTKLETKDWYNAVVPGTILTSLVKQGIYADPYYGLNNLAISDSLCRQDWYYRFAFDAPKLTPGKKATLRFDGINYMAEVYLNNALLGTIKGAFIRGEFDITKLLFQDRKNVLLVRILPPNNPGIPHEQSMISGQGLNGGQLCMDGPTFICTEGWDWLPGIRDRDMGIWQNVSLEINDKVTLKDPYITTDLALPDTSKAELSIYATVKNSSQEAVSGVLKGEIQGTKIAFEHPYQLAAGESKVLKIESSQYPQLLMKNPKLWWPNGYGAPNLYVLNLTAKVNDVVSDQAEFTFGVRELSYEMMVAKSKTDFKRVEYNPLLSLANGKPLLDVVNKVAYSKEVFLPAIAEGADANTLKELDQNDKAGPYLIIKVNGVRIFAKGGNWGMDDAMKDTSREKLEPYFKLTQQENLNIIRNWTGESTQESFYQLADEYGILVWNDFWLTTENSNTDPNDHDLFMKNATDAVKHFRNHPSIAIWCPRNEGFAPIELEKRMADMCAKEDHSRMYHGQSRFLNMGTSGPWGYFEDLSYYYKTRANGFNTEMGSYAIPTVESIKSFIAPEDQWPINDVWAYHDLHHTTQGFPLFMAAVDKFGKPTGLEDFVKKAHIVNYDNWRAMVESWNSKMWDDCTGLILWMSHPAWPSMIWQTYTWDYETPAAYFGTKKAAQPIHVQLNLHDLKVVALNATMNPLKKVKVNLKYFSLEGKLLQSQTKELDLDANKKVDCFVANTDIDLPNVYLARLEMYQNNKLIEINDYWRQGKQNNEKTFTDLNTLNSVDLKYKVTKSDKPNKFTIALENPSNKIAVSIKLNAKNKSGKLILPAYFSDGYFNLLPNEKRTINLELPKEEQFDLAISTYN